ncbi:MAG TPA: AAA family ATPase [Polyangiales bacterium]|nr:AAA family ATPase [Polyangiales bacterium]
MSVIYVFGDFELDEARFELRRSGAPEDVQPKVMRLLLHLASHSERAVGNEELLRVLWPDETVGHGSIKRAVRGARRVLGDDGDSQASIRTVRGFGYQFVIPMQIREAPERPAPSAPAVRSPGNPRTDVFVGRHAVMDRLLTCLTRALAGSTRCVLLTGAPGLGKTRTIEELAQRARQLGADVWVGRCTDEEGAPAFWPFLQVFREALRDRGADRMRELMGKEGAEIADALRELRRELPDLPEAAPLSSTSARFRLFDSVAVFLRRAAEKRTLVLGFDDLHRADPASLRLLVFLVRQLQRSRILIVANYRRDCVRQPQTAELLEELARDNLTRCIELQGWSPREIAHYVELATGSPAPEAVIARLHAQTAGNPLFMQHVVEEGWQSETSDSWAGRSPAAHTRDLRGAIQRHLEAVPSDCRDLLRIAAMLGPEFSAALLARVCGLAVDAVCTRLAEAEASDLVQRRPHDVARYHFRHGLIRDALYSQLSAAERAELHGRAGRALEAQGIGESTVLLAEVTQHFVRAAPAHDAGRALHYTLRSAESALSTLAYEQAAAHFGRALQLAEYQEPDPQRRMQLLFRRGDALARTTERDAARAALYEAAALARELGDTELLVHAAALIASRPEAGSVDAAQVAVVQQALDALEEHDDRRVWLQALLAKTLSYASDPRERVRLARDSLTRARRQPDPALRLEALTRCHEALLGPAHLKERVAISAELMQLAHQRGAADALLRAFSAQVETCLELGDMESIDAAVANMEVLAERVRDPFHRWHCKVVRTMRAYVAGDLALAERRSEDTWQSGAPLCEELARHVRCVQMVAMLRARGRMAQTEPLAREMALRYPTITGWRAAWGVAAWQLGRREQARRVFQQLMDQGQDSAHAEPYQLNAFATIAELCAHLGDATAAAALYDALLPFGEHHGFTHLGAMTWGPMTRYLGLLAECQGKRELAETHFEAALNSASRLRSPMFLSYVGYSYARMLLRDGNAERRPRANELLGRALALAEGAQLPGLIMAGHALATRHGLRIELRTPIVRFDEPRSDSGA